MSSTAIGSTPAKGSSSKTNFGSVARALAISVLLLSPPESKSPLLFLIFCKLNSSNSNSNLDFCSSLDKSVNSKTALILSSMESFLKTEAS